jgi:hypothetical protein
MDTHGYVYAFAHQSNGWIKVGMTEKDDPQRCWGRINHYIKQHRLPEGRMGACQLHRHAQGARA